jgi:hypothetical protein
MNPEAHKFQPSNKHRVITNKDNHEQKANLNRSIHLITTITFAVEGIGN